MIQGLNLLMMLILIGIGCGAFCLRKSPESMARLAAWLMSTSEADVARAKYHKERHEAWRRELGVE